MYPLIRKWSKTGRIVEFISYTTGITLYHPRGLNVGVKEEFRPHTTLGWEPCEDPRQSRTNRMLKAIK